MSKYNFAIKRGDIRAKFSACKATVVRSCIDLYDIEPTLKQLDGGQDASITRLTGSPGNLSWSPDGQWLAFTLRVPADEAPLASMPKAPKGAEWAAPVKVIDRVIYRIDGGGYVDPGYTHVFVVAADGGAARQITSGKHNFNGRPAWSA